MLVFTCVECARPVVVQEPCLQVLPVSLCSWEWQLGGFLWWCLAAGALAVVHCDAAGSASSTIALMRLSVSPTVGKFSIFNFFHFQCCTGLSAQEQFQHHWSHKQFGGFPGSARIGICL